VGGVRLLVVEDDPKMASVLRRGLEREGYVVEVAATGEDAVWAGTEFDFDAVLLDASIPEPDGFEVCRRLRGAGRWMPVMMLTARDQVADRVEGLDSGADDYLTKPFSFDELYARIRSLLRRGTSARPTVLRAGDLTLDPASRRVARDSEPIPLSAREFALLELLMRRSGQVLTRSEIIDHVWDVAFDGGSNVVDVYIRYLREKVDRPFGRAAIETVRGAGYLLRPDGG